MKNRWLMRPVAQPEVVARLRRDLNNLPEALARALALRNVTTFEGARLFFRPSLEHLHDPFLMKDMDVAADRVAQALNRGERILVYGDYDVDGTTSTALMTTFLREMGAEAEYFIPDRFRDGYGLGKTGIDYAVKIGAALIVALDCGITAHEEARYARACGLDLVICDHHTALETIPDAIAVLDPKRPDCPYPFKELCGCGVGFKLVQAVLARLGEAPEGAFAYLDLVAVATASDIVPINGENRVLVREGMARLKAEARLGLRALAVQAKVDLDQCTTRQIVFGIGPRINAAGRLGDAGRAVNLLMARDEAVAQRLAQELEQVNLKRRALDRETLDEAVAMAERQLSNHTRHTLVLHNPAWHLGVIGIVASRLVERFYRPTILMSTVNGYAKGSARSINGINIYQALKACEDLLVTFGGHDYAAGVTLTEANVPAFQKQFDEAVGAKITPDVLDPVIEVDAYLNLADLGTRFWKVLHQFAPFGPQNDTPVFQGRDLEVVGEPRLVGHDGAHLKFAVRQRGGSGDAFDVIGFRMQHHLSILLDSIQEGTPLELLFSVEENTWKGRTSLQLRARDLRTGQAR